MSNELTGNAICEIYDQFGNSREITLDGSFDEIDNVVAMKPLCGTFSIVVGDEDVQLPKDLPTYFVDRPQTVYYKNAVYYSLMMSGRVKRLTNNSKLYIYLHFEDGHTETMALGNASSDTTFSEARDRVVLAEIYAETAKNIKRQNILVNGTNITITIN